MKKQSKFMKALGLPEGIRGIWVVEIDKYAIIITADSMTIRPIDGVGSYCPWFSSGKKEYNAIEPSKPIDEMTDGERELFARDGIEAMMKSMEQARKWAGK
jgi:hypothetical protein